MNSFLYNALALCLVASCALAQYQSAGYGGSYQQRKAAPSPQTYGAPSGGYGAQSDSYADAGHYEQIQGGNGYAKQAASSYGSNSYSAKAAPAQSYAAAPSYSAPKAAPKYEEPYYPPQPFAWGYDINDGYGGAQYHKENGDEYGKRTGSYGYTDAYGIYRQVDYVADENGFRATIKTNEPGTANESPADVELHAYEPPSNYYAGNSYQAGSGSSYQAGSSGYGQAAAAKSSYSAPSYSAAQSAPAAAPASSYGQQSYARSSGYQAAAPRYASAPAKSAYAPQASRSAYQAEPASGYAASAPLPVYREASKASAAAAAAPAKRY